MLPVYTDESIMKQGVKLIAECHSLFESRPSAEDFQMVDEYYSNIIRILYRVIDANARLKHIVLKRHANFLSNIGLKDPLWLKIKNSSTLITNSCNEAAGEAFIIQAQLDDLIKAIKEEKMGMNTLVSAFKDTR